MKIPTSSSIFLATLALSSSSSTLAAPTGHGISDESGMSSSQSKSHIASEGTEGNISERSMVGGDLEARQNGMVSDILAGLPIVGPLARALLVKDCPNPDGPSAESADGVSQDDLARLQNAVDTVSGALNGMLPISGPIPSGTVGGAASMIPVPDPVKSAIAGVADTDPEQPSPTDSAAFSDAPTPTGDAGAAAAGDDSQPNSSFLISPTTTVANAEAAGETPVASNSDSGGNNQATPTVPSGPPNTPAMPETTPDPSQDQGQPAK